MYAVRCTLMNSDDDLVLFSRICLLSFVFPTFIDKTFSSFFPVTFDLIFFCSRFSVLPFFVHSFYSIAFLVFWFLIWLSLCMSVTLCLSIFFAVFSSLLKLKWLICRIQLDVRTHFSLFYRSNINIAEELTTITTAMTTKNAVVYLFSNGWKKRKTNSTRMYWILFVSHLSVCLFPMCCAQCTRHEHRT